MAIVQRQSSRKVGGARLGDVGFHHAEVLAKPAGETSARSWEVGIIFPPHKKNLPRGPLSLYTPRDPCGMAAMGLAG